MGVYHHASGLFSRASAKIGPGDVYDAFALSLLVGQPLPAEDRKLADFEAGWLRNHFVVVFLPLLRRQVEKYLERSDRYDHDQKSWLVTAPDADADELARMFGTATFRSERHRSEHPDDVHNDRWAEIAAAVGRLSRASGLGDIALALAGQGGLLNLVHNTGTSVLDKLPDWHGLWKALEACASGTPAQVYAGASPDAKRLLRLALPRVELLGATASATRASEPQAAGGLDPFRNLRADMREALMAASDEAHQGPGLHEDLDEQEYSVERFPEVPMEKLLQWTDYSSWCPWPAGALAEILRDGGEDALREELNGFRGPDWSDRAMEWLRDGVPAVVFLKTPDGYEDLCDGRGRVSFMIGMGIELAAVAVGTRKQSTSKWATAPQGVLAKAAWSAARRRDPSAAHPVHIALKVLPSGKGQPADDQVFDCVKCGACCACGWAVDLTGGETKRFLADPELRGMVRLNQGIDRWESGEDDEPGFMNEVNVKGFGSQCAALSGKVGRHAPCSIYEKRPRVCRNFKPGSDRCLEARAIHGIDGRHRRRKGNVISGYQFTHTRMVAEGRAAYHAASELLSETRLSLECRCADDFGAGYKDESAMTDEDREHIENYEKTREVQLAMAEEAAAIGLEVSVSDSDDRHSRHSDAYVYFPASRMGEVAAMLGAVGLDGDILDVPVDFPEAEAERIRREYNWSVEREYVSPGGA